jgi:hypothetical protein
METHPSRHGFPRTGIICGFILPQLNLATSLQQPQFPGQMPRPPTASR